MAGVLVGLWRMHLNWKIEFPDRLRFLFRLNTNAGSLFGPPYCGAGRELKAGILSHRFVCMRWVRYARVTEFCLEASTASHVARGWAKGRAMAAPV